MYSTNYGQDQDRVYFGFLLFAVYVFSFGVFDISKSKYEMKSVSEGKTQC